MRTMPPMSGKKQNSPVAPELASYDARSDNSIPQRGDAIGRCWRKLSWRQMGGYAADAIIVRLAAKEVRRSSTVTAAAASAGGRHRHRKLCGSRLCMAVAAIAAWPSATLS
jgi:hypothetical protein